MEQITRSNQMLFLALAIALIAATLFVFSLGSDVSASTITTCQDKNKSCVTYTGTSWKQVRNEKALGGTYRVSSSATRGALFAAAGGPEIKFVTATGPKMGKARVYVMNLISGAVVREVVLDLKTSKANFRVVKTIAGPGPDIPYGLIVVSANGRPVAIDAVKHWPAPTIIPPHMLAGEAPPPPPPGT